MNLEPDISDEEQSDDYEVSENFHEDLVRFCRSTHIGDEAQALVVHMVYGSGLLDDWRDYVGAVITGGASSGKSDLKRDVIDAAYDYTPEWLYKTSSASEKAIIDDEQIDDARIGALEELQKIPPEMMEMFKSVVEDGGFTYGRNVADSDRESGRKTVKIERDPLPIVFMLADENAMEVEQELQSRLIEVKVSETAEINRGVHRSKWGHRGLSIESSDAEYNFEDADLAHAVKSHIRDVPVDTPVVIPTGEGRFVGDGWDAAAVTEPLFTFDRSESTRASTALRSLVKSSALLNYHSRPRVEYDGEQHIVVQPQDVGNIIACREVLLATTHGLNSKKFAIIDAILERGGPVAGSDTALQATKDDVIAHMQDNSDVATMSKTEVRELLNELDEELILNCKDHPEDARRNIYIYDGAATFKRPAIYSYHEQFGGVDCPITGESIDTVIDSQLQRLNATMDTDVSSVAAADAMQGAQDLSDDWDSGLSEDARRVCERLQDTVDGYTVLEPDALQVEHMVGVTPVGYDDGVVFPSREVKPFDKAEGFMAPDNWGEGDFEAVKERVVSAVSELQQANVVDMDEAADGSVHVTVDSPT